MAIQLPIDIDTVKGFLAMDEGEALYHYCTTTSALGACLEVGSYCGKSTVWLGAAAKAQCGVVYAVDHHRGSEEQQPGEAWHDAQLLDTVSGLFDSFGEFRRVIRSAGLDDTVVPIVAASTVAARGWRSPLGMLFIDGGHSYAAALQDYRCWTSHVVRGGILAIHDTFPNPQDGGQSPYAIWRLAKESGLFEVLPTVNTLSILRRL